MSGAQSPLDPYVVRLAQMTEETTMWTLSPDGDVVPYAKVASTIVSTLLVEEATLRSSLDRIAAEIMHWGRVCARQSRCHDIRMRELRQWKAAQELAFRKLNDAASRKTTEAMVEANYRTAPEYEAVQRAVEETEEARLVADAIYQAFRAKKDVLVRDVWRASDGSMQRLST